MAGLAVGSLLSFSSCEEEKANKKVKPYTGPIEEINNVQMLYSEAAKLKVKMTTAKQLRYQNDDRKYPETVNISFFDENGAEVTSLRSDSGRYDRTKDLYTVMGNVEVINKQKQEKLMTNELNWNPNTKKVYTEKPVTVISKSSGETLKGIGLDANQDFSQYSIRKPTGIFNIEGGGGF
ncbi:LPS export ABC transporter periplasmic protein LptC [Nibrella saemangeumensis]|uniref:LPS export ABC transporter periplasmic protein LptC n=2 Tax=Nibrella saemangeumensis TaxID=1084526 RepID=A0ABP8MVK3_9BACT